jgi:hypothetical protein
MNKKTIGLGVLSWKAHQTLKATLDSYKQAGLLSLFDDAVIFFGDISEQDERIAQEYGFRAVGGPNQGIAHNTESLARSINADCILIVQNDNPLTEDLATTKEQIEIAKTLLNDGKADFVRMRHRWNVGEGFDDVRKYLKFFPARSIDPSFSAQAHGLNNTVYEDTLKKRLLRILRPNKAKRLQGRGIFIEQSPEQLFPHHIQKDGDALIVDSSVINFSDQCFMTDKQFFIETIMGYVNTHPSSRTLNGYQVPEICLNCDWWRQQHFKIAQGKGIFTHGRIDGSFRTSHPAYDATQKG